MMQTMMDQQRMMATPRAGPPSNSDWKPEGTDIVAEHRSIGPNYLPLLMVKVAQSNEGDIRFSCVARHQVSDCMPYHRSSGELPC